MSPLAIVVVILLPVAVMVGWYFGRLLRARHAARTETNTAPSVPPRQGSFHEVSNSRAVLLRLVGDSRSARRAVDEIREQVRRDAQPVADEWIRKEAS